MNKYIEMHGKVAAVKDKWGRVLLPAEERSRCSICNQRRHTVVNNVCLSCLQSTKRRA